MGSEELLNQELNDIFGNKTKEQIHQMIKFNQRLSDVFKNKIILCANMVNASFVNANEEVNQREWDRLHILFCIWGRYFEQEYDIDFYKEFDNHYIRSITLSGAKFDLGVKKETVWEI